MPIKKLPPHLINKLKAWEIVERPVAVVKELLENALDAGATRVVLSIEKWWKKLIRVEDNGSGISADDLMLTIERYATSKIASDSDLERIGSYGFRGEALASIGEVSTFRIQTKHKDSEEPVGLELWKDWGSYQTKQIAVPFDHGTVVSVADLFHSVPAREKFLKTDGTEWNYIKQLFLSYCMIHWDKELILENNGKNVFNLKPVESVMERMADLFQDDWEGKWRMVEWKNEQIHVYGVIGDASLHFPSQQYMHIFVNKRPVQDRLLKKSIMDAYERQIVPGSYPFAVLFVDIDPTKVDVNVHPRKLEVKFLDPGGVFTRVKESIKEQLWNQKVNYAAFTKHPVREQYSGGYSKPTGVSQQWVDAMKSWGDSSERQSPSFGGDAEAFQGSLLGQWWSVSVTSTLWIEESNEMQFADDHIRILGQLRQSYIVAQWVNDVYYIDQHALAERVAFEKMRVSVKEQGFTTEVLLQPLTLSFPKHIDVEPFLEKLSGIGFDGALFGEWKIVLYAIPAVFAEWKIDTALVMQRVRWQSELPDDPKELFGTIIDEMLGMKACKASIKAGQQLSMIEMKNLLEEGMKIIDGLFVCQHGRPSVVKVEKKYVEALFERH